MRIQQHEPGPEPGPPRTAAEDEGLERASVPELLVMLAQTEDAIRKAARARYGPTAAMARREEAIVEALRRRHGLAFRTIGGGGTDAEPAAGGGTRVNGNSPVQGTAPGPQKVIVRDGDREVHGYAVSSRGALVEVVWAVASGRVRKRAFPSVDVFLPGPLLQWAGHPVSEDALRLPARAGLGTLSPPKEN